MTTIDHTDNPFRAGLRFFSENKQVWVTALTGLVILAAFVGTAYRFATIARDAQEQLINVRVGSILDTFTLFTSHMLDGDPALVRSHMQSIQQLNPTIVAFTVFAPHGANSWRVVISEGSTHEGAVITSAPINFSLAAADPHNSYTTELMEQGERFFITSRAIVDGNGQVEAIAVTKQRLSEADRQIAENIKVSYGMLAGILLVIMALFFRHARIIDFAQLYRKQKEIDELKDSFLSMASHELKSPLSVIRGYVEFLETEDLDEATRKEYLRRVSVSADELRQLVDDILDVSRIEMGRMRFSMEKVAPHEVIGEVIAMFTDTAGGKGITLTFDAPEIPSSELLITADRGRLKQIVVNLVSNALKYTLTGTVTVRLNEQADQVELSVKDTGVGMTAEERAKLFSKFYRAEADETKAVSGTGLGLWITKYMIEHMKGSISVESIKGEGSRFVVLFPKYSPEQ